MFLELVEVSGVGIYSKVVRGDIGRVVRAWLEGFRVRGWSFFSRR